MNKNSKTTIWGLIAAVAGAVTVLSTQVEYLFDGNPNTNMDIATVVSAVLAAAAMFGLGKAAADAPKNPEKP